MSLLEDDVMWEAVNSCDSKYDGIFLYAVKTTKIFCRPSCKSRTPLRENTLYFSALSLAIKEGFRPCKRCRPDLLEAPNENSIIDFTQKIMDEKYASTLTLDILAKDVGMSKYHLQRLFKKNTGFTPQEYLTKVRMLNSSNLIKSTDHSITDIAHLCGYKSSAHFSEAFYHYFGCSPTNFRKRTRGEDS
jgi:AraC family transcriptional regulator, regulatory protein of adaptative response / methylphosphotriester-DNA alkyltransferase methyltransferase